MKNNINLPKNIKQIGSIDDGFKIYVEDFVFSFLHQYSKQAKGDEALAILIGQVHSIEDEQILFIKGAIKGEYAISQNGILKLTEKSFEYIEKQIDTYFLGQEIVGWFYSQPGFSDYINDEYISYHKEILKNPYQVFFLSDPTEKFFSFYRHNNNAFESIKGFIIYYEKNEAMNEYMLANNNVSINTEKEKFRLKDEKLMEIKRKNIPKYNFKRLDEPKKISNIFGSLSAVLFLVCFVMGAGLIQNDDRISELEVKLNKLDQSYKYVLSQFKDDNVQNVFAEATTKDLSIKNTEIQTSTEILTEDTTQEMTESVSKNTEQTTEVTTNLQREESTTDIYKTYEVKTGDSLEGISKKFYGDRSKINEIMEVNGLDDPHRIYSGMTIKLP